MRRTTIKALALAAAAAMTLTACGGGNGDGGDDRATGNGTDTATEEPDDSDDSDDGGGGSSDPIRVAYLATGSALPMFATAEKYAEQVGITLQMEQVSSGNEAITGVATGQ